jgi:hypothetical protein
MAQSFLNEDELYVPEDIIKEARSVIENLLPQNLYRCMKKNTIFSVPGGKAET